MSDLEKILKLCVDPTLLDSEAEKEVLPEKGRGKARPRPAKPPPSWSKRAKKRPKYSPPIDFFGF